MWEEFLLNVIWSEEFLYELNGRDTCCFFVQRSDGSEEDFSILKAYGRGGRNAGYDGHRWFLVQCILAENGQLYMTMKLCIFVLALKLPF